MIFITHDAFLVTHFSISAFVLSSLLRNIQLFVTFERVGLIRRTYERRIVSVRLNIV